MIIFGIDPGTNHFACSIVEWKNTKVKLLDVRSFNYNPNKSLEHKLKLIYDEIEKITYDYKPDVVAIESQFYGQNPRTLRSLCESVGAIKVSLLNNTDAIIKDYTPTEIKQALTGKGNAKKDDMIESANSLFDRKFNSDEADSMGAVLAFILFGGDEQLFLLIDPFISEDEIDTFALFTKNRLTKKEKDKVSLVKKDIIEYVMGNSLIKFSLKTS